MSREEPPGPAAGDGSGAGVRRWENRLAAIQDTLSEGVITVDEKGIILDVNPAASEIFGYGVEELLGRNVNLLLPEPHRDLHDSYIARYVSTGEARIIGLGRQVEGVRRDGTRFPMYLRVSDVQEAGHRCFVGIVRDLSWQVEAGDRIDLQASALLHAANAIAITDHRGLIEWVNPAFTSLTGYTSEEAVGKNPRILRSGVHDRGFFKELWETVLDGRVWRGETVNRKKDGSLYVEEQTITPVRGRDGRVAHFVAIKNDITARRRAEEALRDQSWRLGERVKELRCLYEVSELVRRTDLSLEAILAKIAALLPPAWMRPEKTCARLVWGAQEFRTDNFRPTDRALVSPILVSGRRAGSVEVGYLGEAGGDGADPFLSEEKDLIGAVADMLGTSIERRSTQEALQRSTEQYRLVVENVQEIIFRCDSRGRWVFLNPAWREILGHEVRPTLGLNFQEFIDPEDHELARDLFRRLQGGEQPSVRSEIRMLTLSGETRWCEVVAVRLEDSEGAFSGCSGTIYDLTRHREVDRLKSDFVSTVSHELRTPLTSIQGSLGLVAGGVAGELSPQALELLSIARRNCERLGLLINDLLDMEKIESGKMVFSIRAVELLPVVEQVADGNSAYAAQFGVTFRIVEPIGGARVKVDPDRLAQVLTNLLSNAAKFSPRGSSVDIAMGRREGRIRVCVSDSGPGIPEEFRPRIFEKFAQADGSEARKRGGSGLGLSISRTIVERLGGSLNFEGRPGGGTTFFFELPELAGC